MKWHHFNATHSFYYNKNKKNTLEGEFELSIQIPVKNPQKWVQFNSIYNSILQA